MKKVYIGKILLAYEPDDYYLFTKDNDYDWGSLIQEFRDKKVKLTIEEVR